MPDIRTHLSTRSKFTWSVGSKAARRNPAPNASSRNLTGSSSRGSTTMSVRHGLPRNSRELGTLKVRISLAFNQLSVTGNSFAELSPVGELLSLGIGSSQVIGDSLILQQCKDLSQV